jgi:hypothetical protein
MDTLNNETGTSTSEAAINAAQGNGAPEKTAPVAAPKAEAPKAEASKAAKAKPAAKADNANPAPETKAVRFPLAIFRNKKFLEKFPKGIQARLNKAGITKAGGREWGPEIMVTDKEARTMFDIAQNIYRNVDNDADKNMKTFGYQLRNQLAENFGYHVEVRVYNRKPKPAPVTEQPAPPPVAETAANTNVHEEPVQLAASMPPRANIDRANDKLAIALTILEENGQTGVANLIREAKTEITIEA